MTPDACRTQRGCMWESVPYVKREGGGGRKIGRGRKGGRCPRVLVCAKPTETVSPLFSSAHGWCCFTGVVGVVCIFLYAFFTDWILSFSLSLSLSFSMSISISICALSLNLYVQSSYECYLLTSYKKNSRTLCDVFFFSRLFACLGIFLFLLHFSISMSFGATVQLVQYIKVHQVAARSPLSCPLPSNLPKASSTVVQHKILLTVPRWCDRRTAVMW